MFNNRRCSTWRWHLALIHAPFVTYLLLLTGVTCFPKLDDYKQTLQVAPHGPNLIATSHNLQQVQAECQQALNRLANSWHQSHTRMDGLVKPSYVFRLQDAPPKPQLAQLMQPHIATQMWQALLERVLTGPWMDPAWQTQVQQPWTLEHLCYMFVLMANGNIPPNAPAVCLPVDIDALPPGAGPYHLRQYLSKHGDGYIMVNLGTNDASDTISIPLHTIITFAFHGPPQLVPVHDNSDSSSSSSSSESSSGDDDDDMRYQEVGHLCGNPWCINFRHLVWCTHRQNCNHHH
jgi:hypothetical protein